MKQTVRAALIRSVTWMPGLSPETRRSVLRRCDIRIGEGTHINYGCTFTPGTVTIGDNSFVAAHCMFDAGAPITIGDGVDIAFEVTLVTSSHKIAGARRRAGEPCDLPITIEDGCWIGAAVKVLPGVTIGHGCIIAAGAVVAADCEPNGLYGGVPARRIKDLDPSPEALQVAAPEEIAVPATSSG